MPKAIVFFYSKVNTTHSWYPSLSFQAPGPEYGDSSDGSDPEAADERRAPKPSGLVGLQNIGNTCYLNAAVQALSNTLPLRSFFLECSPLIDALSEGRKPGLCRTYHALMRDIWTRKSGGYVTPSGT